MDSTCSVEALKGAPPSGGCCRDNVLPRLFQILNGTRIPGQGLRRLHSRKGQLSFFLYVVWTLTDCPASLVYTQRPAGIIFLFQGLMNSDLSSTCRPSPAGREGRPHSHAAHAAAGGRLCRTAVLLTVTAYTCRLMQYLRTAEATVRNHRKHSSTELLLLTGKKEKKTTF